METLIILTLSANILISLEAMINNKQLEPFITLLAWPSSLLWCLMCYKEQHKNNS